MDRFISYEGLPINSGGSHSLGKKSVDKIYSDTLEFLHQFTNCSQPIESQLIFYSSQNGSYKTAPTLWQLVKSFGIPSCNIWNLAKIRQHFFTWKLQRGGIEMAFKCLHTFSNLPENQYGPIVLSLKWHFQFIDPLTKEVLEGQDKIPVVDSRQYNSQIHLRLGQKSTISAWLTLPFSELDDDSKKYIKSMTNQLPFYPSDKHWRLWKKSKKENWVPQVIDINAG
jgi:hypothetical protein